MAHIASNNNGNTNLTTTTPFMDRLTHSVIKETSKSLRYYIDVKRRENAFVLNPNTSALDSIPLKARYIYGTTKEYPPLYGSCHSDTDVKVYLRSFQQQQKRKAYSTSNSPEKQMCREELNFHMRPYKYSPRENRKFGELRLRPPIRSSSSCSRTTGRDSRRRIPKSAFKLPRHEQYQLVDNAADILASMIKTRRTIYETNFLAQQIPPLYISQNANPSPRQPDDQSVSSSSSHPSTDLKLLKIIEQPQKPKRTTENALEKAASIMYNAKPIPKGLLCEYKVSVTTGNCNGASTNAPIRIKFYGTNGYTNFLDLVDSETHRVPFSKDQTDVFMIQTDHVGQLAGITIGHDRKDIRSGWFLSKVSIDDPIRDITYDIPCNAWLSSKSNDQKTMRDFQVSSMISHKKHIDSNEHREEIDGQSGSSSTTTPSGTSSDHTQPHKPRIERPQEMSMQSVHNLKKNTSSNTTNSSQNDELTGHKRTKKHQKQARVSIGPTTIANKPTTLAAITNHLSQPPPATTVESHFNRNEFAPPPVPTHRIQSPIISSSSSSDTEIENNFVNHNHSPTPSPTFDQSRIPFASDHNTSQTTDTTTNHNRPPARLEKRSSPISLSPERPIKNKEETNENDAFSFFD